MNLVQSALFGLEMVSMTKFDTVRASKKIRTTTAASVLSLKLCCAVSSVVCVSQWCCVLTRFPSFVD